MTNEEFRKIQRENRRANRRNKHFSPAILTEPLQATPRKEKILDLNDGTHFATSIIREINRRASL